VVLLVDKREKQHTFLESVLEDCGVACDVCPLSIGDYVWVARQKKLFPRSSFGTPDNVYDYESDSSVSVEYTCSSQTSKAGRKREKHALEAGVAVLDCVIERKTVEDLASSICDGRYHEQKQRLMSCGVKKVVYLLEGLTLNPAGVGGRDWQAGRGRGRGRSGGVSGGVSGGGGRSSGNGNASVGRVMTSSSILSAIVSTQLNGAAIGLCASSRGGASSEGVSSDGVSSEGASSEGVSSDDEEEEEEDRDGACMHIVQTRGIDQTVVHLKLLHRYVVYLHACMCAPINGLIQ
jgi:hypothetical protein